MKKIGLQLIFIKETINMSILEKYLYQLSKVWEAFIMFKYTKRELKFKIKSFSGMIFNKYEINFRIPCMEDKNGQLTGKDHKRFAGALKHSILLKIGV